jgi:hypothetical protein
VNVYPFIEAEKTAWRTVKPACELLQVSRSAYYHATGRGSALSRTDAALTARIIEAHQMSKGTYGAPGWGLLDCTLPPVPGQSVT